MAIQAEIWQNQIVENLYKGNEFMNYSTPEDQYVTMGKVVHIPNAGAPSAVIKDRATLPATIGTRTDVDITYTLGEYTSNPIFIPNIDTIQLAYDKRASVLMNDMAQLRQVTADGMLAIWAGGATNIVRTTGAAAATTAGGSATGNRKLFSKLDLLSAKILMDKQLIPMGGRVALLPPDFGAQLLQDKDLVVNFEKYADLANGVIGRLYGFDLMIRGTVLMYDNASTPVVKAPYQTDGSATAIAAADNQAALCWHPTVVARALGDVKMFEWLNSPTYYGDVYSFLCMLGGRVRRNDGKGIVAIVEAASA